MSFSGILLDALFAGLAAIAARRHDTRVYLWFAAIAVGGLALSLAVYGIRREPVWLPDLVLAAGAALMAAQAFGLPLPIARRLKFGLRSREWEFDRQLYAVVADLNAMLAAYPGKEDLDSNRAWGLRLEVQGPQLITRLRRLQAPNGPWHDLASDYADLYGLILDRVRGGPGAPDPARIQRIGEELSERRATLRRAYRAEAERILSE